MDVSQFFFLYFFKIVGKVLNSVYQKNKRIFLSNYFYLYFRGYSILYHLTKNCQQYFCFLDILEPITFQLYVRVLIRSALNLALK